MQLTWNKCNGDVWCNLYSVNLSHAHFDNMHGVYIIWHGGATPSTVYVGQGFVRGRLIEHKANPQIQRYSQLGLYVTWASVAQTYRDGVEAWLAAALHPKEGQAHPN